MTEQKSESLRITGISKRYHGVTALDEVDMVLRRGEIHGLVGKNGAGKSTVVKVIYGAANADAGKIEVNGPRGTSFVDLQAHSPIRAREMGIFMVPQEPVFALDLTIEENFFMANPIMKSFLSMNRKEMRERTANCMRDFGLHFSPNAKVREVPMEDRHLLYTALVVDLYPSEIVLLDEVTSALRKDKCDILFAYLDKVKKNKSIVLITHRINETLEFCDKVTVFRNGKRIITDDTSNLTAREMANLIVGENVETPSFKDDVYINYAAAPKPILSIENFTREPFYRDMSFTLHEGEILGITGLVESGVAQLLRSITGIEEIGNGRLSYRGEAIASLTPEKAMGMGLAYGTNDRLNEGNFPDLSVMDNINSCVWPRLSKPPLGFISRKEELENYQTAIENFNLKCPSPKSGVLTLSGGNQQKAILTRLIAADASVYVFDEPTKGIDVGTVYEILRYLRLKVASRNRGVIVNLSSIEELMLVCDRIIVVYDGSIAGEFNRTEFNEARIFRMVQGVH